MKKQFEFNSGSNDGGKPRRSEINYKRLFTNHHYPDNFVKFLDKMFKVLEVSQSFELL